MAHLLTIQPSGAVRLIYDDDLRPLMAALGTANIRRASHVNADDDGFFWSDLSPMNGPRLGPFLFYAEAIASEREWLEARL